MAEYIEREEAIKFVNQNICHFDGETTLSCVEICLRAAPTADVVEVKHGEWITPTKIKSMNIAVPHCSLCGNVPCDKAFYCPYCGAKMDLKEGAEE